MKVFAYYNLHRKLWSLKALEGQYKGKVIAHSLSVILENCTFKVSEAGRQRVLRERKKNVHAGVIGDVVHLHFGADIRYGDADFVRYVTVQDSNNYPMTYVGYNPYKYSTFVTETGKPVTEAVLVTLSTNRLVIAFGAK